MNFRTNLILSLVKKVEQDFTSFGTLLYKEGSRFRSYIVTKFQPTQHPWQFLGLACAVSIAARLFYKVITSYPSPPPDQNIKSKSPDSNTPPGQPSVTTDKTGLTPSTSTPPSGQPSVTIEIDPTPSTSTPASGQPSVTIEIDPTPSTSTPPSGQPSVTIEIDPTPSTSTPPSGQPSVTIEIDPTSSSSTPPSGQSSVTIEIDPTSSSSTPASPPSDDDKTEPTSLISTPPSSQLSLTNDTPPPSPPPVAIPNQTSSPPVTPSTTHHGTPVFPTELFLTPNPIKLPTSKPAPPSPLPLTNATPASRPVNTPTQIFVDTSFPSTPARTSSYQPINPRPIPPPLISARVAEVKDASPSVVNPIINIFNHCFVSHSNTTKLIKYHHIRNQTLQYAGQVPALPADSTPEETADWNKLLNTLEYRPLDESSRHQYRAFVAALRQACKTFRNKSNDPRTSWISSIAYNRFMSIGLFTYCKELILHNTNKEPFPELSLSNFNAEFVKRNELLNKLTDADGMPSSHREILKLAGTANILFDPLAGGNLPYVDGVIHWNGKTITLLRHGVPLTHNDLYGFGAGVIDGVTSYIPILNRYSLKAHVSSLPEVNADYLTFVKEAAQKEQNILHVILENGEEKTVGDESARVKVRLAIQEMNPNFFPIALRLDGEFFEPKNFTTMTVNALMHHLISEMTLKEKGFDISKIPVDLKKNLKTILSEIKKLYFKDDTITSLADYQAFILLSYANIILHLCTDLNISILEALCKDDIDRGNVVKTILKLHLLYVTGNITSENLQKILVNTLVAPVIVKKQGVIPSRSILIEHVCQRMVQAYSKTYQEKQPSTDSVYEVWGDPSQGIIPRCSSAENELIYCEYLNHLIKEPFSSPFDNPIKELAETDNINSIQKQIFEDFNSNLLSIYLKNQGLLKDIDTETMLINKISQYLLENKISPQETDKIISSIQLTHIIDTATAALMPLFNNTKLGITLNKHLYLTTQLHLRVSNGVAQLTWTAFFKIASKKKNFFNIKVALDIPDHQKKKAEIFISKYEL